MGKRLLPVAVTGGIAEGKSTVVGFLSEFGLKTWSADAVVAELWQKPGHREAFLEALDLPDTATSKDVRESIQSSVEARRTLNAIIHPMVMKSMFTSNAEVFEVPLLIEAAIHHHFERVWVVTCGEQEQRCRLMHRLGDEEETQRALSLQLPTRCKIAFADEVFRTNFPLPSVREEVIQALKSWKALG